MTYIEAIGAGFPGVFCHTVGAEDLYENIVWDSGLAIPDKATLDQWIASNPTLTNGTKLTVLAFRNRFTKTEKITMEMASLDNPAAPMGQRQLAAAIRVDMKDSDNASFIDLTRPETIAGVTALETYGIIGAGRGSIILTTPVSDIEKYQII